MPFLTRPHFEDRQIVQYSNESVSLSGITYIASTLLGFSGITTGETSVTINTLTGYLRGERLSGLVIEPARLALSGTTGTTTQNVTGFVLQSIDPYGSVEWAPLSGVSWSVSACTSPLYVSTIEACPNPTDPIYITAGNVQFGASPSLIADITNTRLGIGTGSPSDSLHIENGDILIQNSSGERFYSDMGGVVGPRVLISADTNSLASFNVAGNAIGGNGGLSMGIIGLTASFPGYGKQGDGFIYSSVYNNGLNIISSPTTGPQITDDYIRFYAGQDATIVTPQLHIQGSGVTRGNIGINTINPTEKLHIQDGNLLVTHNQNTITKIDVTNFNGSNDAKSTLNLHTSGSSLTTSVAGTISAIGPNSIPTGTFMGSYLPNSLNITTAGGTLSNRLHINIGSRRGTDAQTRFFGGSDNFDSSSLLGVFYTSGLTITDMVNTNTLKVRNGATFGHVLTSDASGNATWQYNSTGFSGNTSASCITDLYVSNIHGCSPITIHDNLQFNGSYATGVTSFSLAENSRVYNDNSSIFGGKDNTISGSSNTSIILGGRNNVIGSYGSSSGWSSILGGKDNSIIAGGSSLSNGIINSFGSTLYSSRYATIIGGSGNRIGNINGGPSDGAGILGGSLNTIERGSPGLPNASWIIGGYSNRIGDTTLSNQIRASVIIGGSDNVIKTPFTTNKGSVILGGEGITGTTINTVYTPNLTASGDHILHSDNILEVTDIPGSLESQIKGSYTEFNWFGTVANVISNNNPSGFTSFITGNVSQYPTTKTYGFISYYNSGFTRSGTPSVGAGFNRNKLFLKASEDTSGMVINPQAGNPSSSLWFEMNGSSVMKLKGNGAGKARLGIAMSVDGTEDATANLQIGGTGTTGTFKYRDGNQQSGYVLTSDSDGNTSWAPPSFTGNTSATCITDLYVTNVHGCSPITFHDNIQSSNSSATGTTSFAFGENNKSFATSAFAFGTNLTVNGERSFAGGGLDNTVGNGINNAIIGGHDNSVSNGVNNTVIIGGGNRIATKSDTVYVPSLVSSSLVVESSGLSVIGNTVFQAKISKTGSLTTIGTESPASSALTETSIWKVGINGTNTATLPDGDDGQRLSVYVVSNTGVSMTITPTTFNGYTSVQLNALGESVDLIWDVVGWTVLGGNGYTLT